MKKLFLMLMLTAGFIIQADEEIATENSPYSNLAKIIFTISATQQEETLSDQQTNAINPLINTPEKQKCAREAISFFKSLAAARTADEANQFIEEFIPKQAKCMKIQFAPNYIRSNDEPEIKIETRKKSLEYGPYSHKKRNYLSKMASFMVNNVEITHPHAETKEERQCVLDSANFLASLAGSENSQQVHNLIKNFESRDIECTKILYGPDRLEDNNKN